MLRKSLPLLVSSHVTCDGFGPFRQSKLKEGALKEQSKTE
jgi:hypothetical protein